MADDEDADQIEAVKFCYVQACPATPFGIKWTLHRDFDFDHATDYLAAKCWIDGIRVNSLVLMRRNYRPSENYTVERTTVSVNSRDGVVKRHLVFGDLEWCEEDYPKPLTELNPTSGELGTIIIEIWRKRTITKKNGHSIATSFSGTDSVSEKALKGDSKSLSVQLGHVASSQRTKNIHSGLPVRDEPDAIFVFKYRSVADLQALHVFPDKPETPLEERHIQELTMDEMRELLRRHRAERDGRATKVKEEFKVGIQLAPCRKHDRHDDGDEVEQSQPLKKNKPKIVIELD